MKTIINFFIVTLFINFLSAQCNCPTSYYNIGSPGTFTYLSSLNIGPTVPSNRSFCIKGTLIMDEDLTTNSSTFHMASGSRIHVLSGKKFRAERCTFQSINACNSMWDGITVYGEFEGPVCTFKNASRAISIQSGGNIIELYSSNFLNCRIGIYCFPTSNLNPPSVLSNNSYICNGTLIPPFAGQRSSAGMYLTNATVTVVGGNYYNLDNGIIATKTTATVKNTDMRLCLKGIDFQDNSILTAFKNVMNVTDHGIRVGKSKANLFLNTIDSFNTGIGAGFCQGKEIEIINNELTNGRSVGISFGNNSPTLSTKIENNTINMFQIQGGTNSFSIVSGITMTNAMRARENAIVKDNTLNINVLDRISDGFTILNIELVQFSNNTVNFLGTSSTSTTIRGFDALNTQRLYSYNLSINGSTMVKNRGVDNAMSPYNRYCCTNIKDQKIGVVLSGACNRTRMTKTTYSGVISDVGLNYIDVFIGVPHFFPGNDWSASFPNLAARYTGPGNNINRNKLIMSTNQLPFYPQGVISVPTGQPLDWFDVQPGQESTCFESSDCNDTPRPLPPNFCDVVNSQGIGGEELTWQARKFLLEDMYSNPMNSEYSDPCFQNFQLQNQNSILGILSQVSNGMKTLHNYSANIEIQMNSINVQINASNNTIKNLLEQLEIPNADSASIYTAINSQQTILAGLQQAQETLLVQHKQEVDAKAALLHSQLANLSSTNPMEQNDLFVTKLYLSSGVWGFTEISYADSSTLTSIAALCPNIGGDAVYRARAILNTTNPELVWEDATCSPQPAQTNSRKEDVIKHSSFAFPNPAQNYILVDLSKYGKNSNLSLVLTDLNHKKQLHVNPEVNSTLVKLDVNNLTNGIYILHLLKDGKSEQKEKISIIR